MNKRSEIILNLALRQADLERATETTQLNNYTIKSSDESNSTVTNVDLQQSSSEIICLRTSQDNVNTKDVDVLQPKDKHFSHGDFQQMDIISLVTVPNNVKSSVETSKTGRDVDLQQPLGETISVKTVVPSLITFTDAVDDIEGFGERIDFNVETQLDED